VVEHVGVELEEGLVRAVVVDQLCNLGEVHTRHAIHTVSMAMLLRLPNSETEGKWLIVNIGNPDRVLNQ